MTPEGKVKAAVKKALKPYVDAGLVWEFMPVPSGYGKQSLDFLLCVGGMFVAVETKAPGKKPTSRQELVIGQIIKAGGEAFVISSIEGANRLEAFLKGVARDAGFHLPQV